MRIGELAQSADMSTKTIRYYEHVGILPSQRERSPDTVTMTKMQVTD
jgi:DNA-binding transcriptional MerR regulator